MINGTVIIKEGKVFSVELTKDGESCDDPFQKLMLLRDIVRQAVDNYEKDNQRTYIEEARNAKPYEDPDLPK